MIHLGVSESGLTAKYRIVFTDLLFRILIAFRIHNPLKLETFRDLTPKVKTEKSKGRNPCLFPKTSQFTVVGL
jgi:hypothetical protein